jgi:hypothetical protein
MCSPELDKQHGLCPTNKPKGDRGNVGSGVSGAVRIGMWNTFGFLFWRRGIDEGAQGRGTNCLGVSKKTCMSETPLGSVRFGGISKEKVQE